jgi:SAM-dependent methyltransferase
MPSMYEIYQSHADAYDELVRYEDHQGNLRRVLHGLVDFSGKQMVEFGAGTGRLTELYAELAGEIRCYDRSEDMRRRAMLRLASYAGKLEYGILDHAESDPEDTRRADIVIEGWAFGHTVFDRQAHVARITAELVDCCRRLLRPGGTMVFIETLGTNVESPSAPGEILNAFYSELEQRHEFKRHIVSTDFRFPSLDAATRHMGFFFGQPMAQTVLARGSEVVPEFTGIWLRRG